METFDTLVEFQKAIVKVYNVEGLSSLRGMQVPPEYILNGKEILLWHNDVVRKARMKRGKEFDYLMNLDDLFFCSDTLAYNTAHLYLYLPHLNNPIEEGFKHYEFMVYPNYQNLFSKRYAMFADSTCQAAYNFWSRIADLIASFFPEVFGKRKIYFSNVLDFIPEEFHNSENYLWLKSFSEEEYMELNASRKGIVHTLTNDTVFKYAHLEASHDIEKMKDLLAQRDSLPEFYKRHIALTLVGFEKTLLFLEEVSTRLFADIAE